MFQSYHMCISIGKINKKNLHDLYIYMSYFHNIFKYSNNTTLDGIFQVSWKILEDFI